MLRYPRRCRNVDNGEPSAAAPVSPNAPAAAQAAGPATLPHDLSPWSMFMQADMVVKAVMVGLAFASLLTWTVWLAKGVELHSRQTQRT